MKPDARTPPLSCKLPPISEADLHLLSEALTGGNKNARRGLIALLEDPEEGLELLDQPAFTRLAEQLKGQLSENLSCYMEVRKRLRLAAIEDRSLAIYLTNIWVEYRQTGILPKGEDEILRMLKTVDILRELNFIEGYDKFELLARSGNYYLFLMAFFEGYFHDMENLTGNPGIAYYEAFARIAFRAARDHRLSDEFDLWSVYDTLSERFSDVRLALSGLKKPA